MTPSGYDEQFSDVEIDNPLFETVPNFDSKIGMPFQAYYSCKGFLQRFQFKNERILPNVPQNLELARQIRREYWKSVSVMDEAVGIVLKTLDSSKFARNTVVVFLSDHGFSLGEHSMYCKQSVFDVATRIPLMIRVPWKKSSSYGRRTKTVAELVDLYPTLVHLSGKKGSMRDPCTSGKDLTQVFNDPLSHMASNDDALGGISPFTHRNMRSYALMQFPRCNMDFYDKNPFGDPCSFTFDFQFMGYSIRTNRFRYTEWRHWKNGQADWSLEGLAAQELYEHPVDDFGTLDFDAQELENRVHWSRYSGLVYDFSNALRLLLVDEHPPDECLPRGISTVEPSSYPSQQPSTLSPSGHPTLDPTISPTLYPTSAPSTHVPTGLPSSRPSSASPTSSPTSSSPSTTPSMPRNKTLEFDLNPLNGPQGLCDDEPRFCEQVDWTCNEPQVCPSRDDPIFCPCWQLEESHGVHHKPSVLFLSLLLVFVVAGIAV